MIYRHLILLLVTILFVKWSVFAQISPGELSKSHSFLEGVSNCTKCHDLGNKVTRDKCLDCHKEIKSDIRLKKGLHSTVELLSKDCFACHNDHHGQNFKMIKFDKATFNHTNIGFELKGAHSKEDCKGCNCNICHKAAFIKDPELKKKSSTYLGLNRECLSCHEDFHKGKMSPNCLNCHGFDTFKKAAGFDHNTTKYPLTGKHKTVSCEKCHKPASVNGKNEQRFDNLLFNSCTNCHKDVHEDKFGQDCKKCHTEESFHLIKETGNFNHDKTDFKLVGKHQALDCKKCHKRNLIDKIKSEHCWDCHADYHKNEFTKNGVMQDCDQCHNNNGFTETLYTIEKHNTLNFKLEGGHLATPCIACHMKQEKWTFVKIGSLCIDCHQNTHKGFIQEKYFPNGKCTECHTINNWKTPEFDHSRTNFKLQGAHGKVKCTTCHYLKNETGIIIQKFEGLSMDCVNCHKNSHESQFDINGKTDCLRCHGLDNWKQTIFDHKQARFKLEGAHLKVSCEKCHKEVINANGKFIVYKNNKLLCSDCHR